MSLLFFRRIKVIECSAELSAYQCADDARLFRVGMISAAECGHFIDRHVRGKPRRECKRLNSMSHSHDFIPEHQNPSGLQRRLLCPPGEYSRLCARGREVTWRRSELQTMQER